MLLSSICKTPASFFERKEPSDIEAELDSFLEHLLNEADSADGNAHRTANEDDHNGGDRADASPRVQSYPQARRRLSKTLLFHLLRHVIRDSLL